MSHRRVTIGLVLSLALPATSRADSFFFDNYCVMGAFPVCASVRVFTTGNTLIMQVWNLEGTFGTPHTLKAIGLYHSGTPWSGEVEGFKASYVTGGGRQDITQYWEPEAQNIGTLAGIEIELAAGTDKGHEGGIVGCTDPGGQTHFSTCSSFPGAPYVEFEFTLDPAFVLGSDLQLRWHSVQMGPNFEESTKCDTGGAGDYPPCVAIPEPFTVVLLGTGLVGIGGVGVIRRRRRGSGATS